jgi:predicted dehydrogenase
MQGSAMASSASAAQAPRPASDRIRIGVIGCGGMGRMDLTDFHRQRDAEIAAVCDVFQPNAQRAREAAGGKAEIYADFRRVLDRRDIDAVVIATPDHWHPLMAVLACDAGKDVYVEKPVSHNVREGRLMVEAARRNRRVVQVGLQQRSGTHFQRAVRAVQEGRIGRVHFAQCWNHMAGADPKGMGFPKDSDPPADLDWDMWLGPAPQVPYNPARRNFRVWWDYAGGELTNWCVHLIDVVHWATGLDQPLSVASSGGKYHVKDCRECPDTQEVLWEYPDLLVRYSTMVHNSFGPNGDAGNKPFGSYGIMLQGTEGTVFIDRAGYQITPQAKGHAEPVSQPWREAFDDLTGIGMYYTSEAVSERGTTSVQHMPHVRNFLDCVKSREKPAADIETGHRSTATCLIGNIALQTGQKLQWDGQRERFINSDAANRRLSRTYRKPWQLPGMEA